MRVEVNHDGKGGRMGSAMPAEAVAAQIARVDKSTERISEGITLLTDSVASLLTVNRDILGQMRSNTDQLVLISGLMTQSVAQLAELVNATAALHAEMVDTHMDLRQRIDQEYKRVAV